MDLCDKIQAYLGRKIDFNTEVILRAGEDNIPYIDTWNITDRPKPSKLDLDRVKEPLMSSFELKAKALLDCFNTFYPELRAFFRGAKDEVLDYLANEDISTAIRIIQMYPLPPGYTFSNSEGQEESLESYKQKLIDILQGE